MSPYAMPHRSRQPWRPAPQFDSQCLVSVVVDQVSPARRTGPLSQIYVRRVIHAPAQSLYNQAWTQLSQQVRGGQPIEVELLDRQILHPNQMVTLQAVLGQAGHFSYWRLFDEHLVAFNA